MFKFLRRVPLLPQPRDEAVMLINLIKMNRDWVIHTHYWYHPSGINMWIGNPDIGIGVKWDSTGPDDWLALTNCQWQATSHEAKLIKDAMATHHDGVIEDKIQDVARKILKMYGDT